ncbi:MAG: dephospho-CoA kinase [Alphaproteobacteria bacterium]|jgi:dephospho-CoA kinase|nr:dephospho-CoA kinase [Alphaproteobacteria bacterium]MBT7943987.1 dephospho-CoA kinase [Alphaproteobacteria bacterium]
MIILGLTGSIGMGKSAAADNFRRLGVPVHDADRTVHKLMGKGGEAVDIIKTMFPAAVHKGVVDRDAIASEVFADPNALARIEQALHPLVRRREKLFLSQTARQGRALVVLDVPLLFETEGEGRCDGVVTVSAPAFVQRQRVLRRPGMTSERLDSILARQMPDGEKRKRSDFVVFTGLGRYYSLRQIQKIVRLTRDWQGNHWPPRAMPGG